MKKSIHLIASMYNLVKAQEVFEFTFELITIWIESVKYNRPEEFYDQLQTMFNRYNDNVLLLYPDYQSAFDDFVYRAEYAIECMRPMLNVIYNDIQKQNCLYTHFIKDCTYLNNNAVIITLIPHDIPAAMSDYFPIDYYTRLIRNNSVYGKFGSRADMPTYQHKS